MTPEDIAARLLYIQTLYKNAEREAALLRYDLIHEELTFVDKSIPE